LVLRVKGCFRGFTGGDDVMFNWWVFFYARWFFSSAPLEIREFSGDVDMVDVIPGKGTKG